MGWDGMEWGVIANLERERENRHYFRPSSLFFSIFLKSLLCFSLLCSTVNVNRDRMITMVEAYKRSITKTESNT